MKSWTILLYIFASLILLLSIGWLFNQPGFEPVITLVGAIITLGGLLTKNKAEDLQKLRKWIATKVRIVIAIGGIIILILGMFIGIGLQTAYERNLSAIQMYQQATQTHAYETNSEATQVFLTLIYQMNSEATKPAQQAATSVYATVVNEKLSLDNLIGDWQTLWDTELIIVSIPIKPVLGEVSGTIGYLYQEEQYHCGIDIWYVGKQGTSQVFNAKSRSGSFTPILGKVLPSCEEIGIKPFTRYEITFMGDTMLFKQFDGDEEKSSTELQRVEK